MLLGGTVASLPALLAFWRPGRALTRHAIAVGQMLMSALLIHLTGGRIETHFHVFGSLAFLAFYRDWKVLVTASAVVAADHLLRGLYWPQSVFGVLADGGWRWLEHAGWVAFEDAFLVPACLRGLAEMRAGAERQARLEAVNAGVEATVQRRTHELRLLQTLTAAIAQAPDVPRALEVGLQQVCATTGWAVGQAWLPGPADGLLHLAASACAAGSPAETFLAGRRQAAPPAGQGLCERVWQSGGPVWIKDVTREPDFPHAEAAAAAGLRAGVGIPIRAGEKVLAVIEFFTNEPREEDEAHLALVAGAAAQLGSVLLHKRTEEALRVSEGRLRAVVSNAPVVLFALDRDGVFTLSEGRGLEGMGQGAAVGRSAFEVYQEAPELVNYLRRALAGDAAGATVEVGQRAYEARHTPLCDPEGQVEGIIGVATDVTERRQAEVRLREQAALLDKAQDAIVACGLDGAVAYWNPSAERLYGWSAAQAMGRPVGELLYGGSSAELEAAAEALREAGEWSGELRQRNRTAKEVRVEARWTLVRDAAGRPTSQLMVHPDVTDKRRLEGQLLRAQRLESLGTLAGGIAHDLNNVLTPIVMAIQLLRMRSTDEQSNSFLAMMEESAQRGAEMVRQILSFARGAEGRRVPLALPAVVKEVAKLLGRTLPKSIVVRADMPGDLWPVVGDATQLHQVLMNLCVNARDAMPTGGQLVLRARNANLDEADARTHLEARPGPHVLLEVSDTGLGMSADVLERIFDPFYTTKELGKGTGLGLSTALGIVKSHGGFITVYSEPGHGTKFCVYLPAADGLAEATPEGTATKWAGGAGALVLVADDEAAIRQITRGTLEASGYRVVTARDGLEAVALYRQHGREVSVVLTDVMMPGMDGLATTEALRQIDPGVRVVAASGLASHARGARDKGAVAFLAKPYKAAELLKVLEDARRPSCPSGPDTRSG